ncbi:transporter substrate-binding domain-containing protein [Legionella nagasakiensis]|uniref:transporter substrate-binding domain-containing protein n=1 Tax=Legionella nagasakiensis TaxID=535290 RepID=UPI00105559A5|nr:transporter substrate-binding domain-containing protein [Legionella nagasakiensis]
MKTLVMLIALLTTPCLLANKLIIGSAPLNPPFETLATEPNHFFGFDIDLMLEICKRIHAQCDFTPLPFDNLFSNIKEGKINLAIAAITITPARASEFLFSLPYMESNGRFLTLKKSIINDPAAIKGKKIGVRKGTPYKDLAKNLYENNVQVIEYPLNTDLLEALANATVDIILVDSEVAKYWAANNDTYKLIGSKLPVGEGYGIMTTLDNSELIAAINEALLNMESDGKYLEIYRNYFELK